MRKKPGLISDICDIAWEWQCLYDEIVSVSTKTELQTYESSKFQCEIWPQEGGSWFWMWEWIDGLVRRTLNQGNDFVNSLRSGSPRLECFIIHNSVSHAQKQRRAVCVLVVWLRKPWKGIGKSDAAVFSEWNLLFCYLHNHRRGLELRNPKLEGRFLWSFKGQDCTRKRQMPFLPRVTNDSRSLNERKKTYMPIRKRVRCQFRILARYRNERRRNLFSPRTNDRRKNAMACYTPIYSL